MLLHLIAFGFLAVETPAGTGTITVPAGQLAVIKPGVVPVVASPIPTDAASFPRPFDPADRRLYAMDWTQHLETGEKIIEILALTMLAPGVSAGVMIDSGGGRNPIIGTDGKRIQLWFRVSPGNQFDPVFNGAGLQVGVAVLVRTDSSPSQEYERTVVLTVRQQ